MVIGIGNPDRGDDAVGRTVARALCSNVPAEVRVAEQDGEAMALLEELRTAQRVWLIDAARSGAPPGTIHRIDCSAADAVVPRGSCSTHGFGLAEAVALARVLDCLPERCIVYAIEAADFTTGAALSPAVAAATHAVAAAILRECAGESGPSGLTGR